jgi:uncharacterized OB-fold protein
MVRGDSQRRRQKTRRWEDKQQLKIPKQMLPELRTLTRAARKQMKRERAPKLWIFPSNKFVSSEKEKAAAHPRASLLGLPKELRQRILVESCSVQDLKSEAFAFPWADKKQVKNLEAGSKLPLDLLGSKLPTLLAKVSANPQEEELLATLCKKAGNFSCISAVIRQDMPYVANQWLKSLDEHLDKERQTQAQASELYAAALPAAAGPVRRNQGGGQIMKHKKSKPYKKFRPMQCWDCGKRHHGIDPICPMARADPEKWKQMTKKVVGKRNKAATKYTESRAVNTKIVFDD